MSSAEPSGELRGQELPLDRVSYEMSWKECGEFQFVTVTFDLGFAEFDVDFELEEAEQFIVEFRDELVRAKQAELEYETNTDPESGVAATDGGTNE